MVCVMWILLGRSEFCLQSTFHREPRTGQWGGDLDWSPTGWSPVWPTSYSRGLAIKTVRLVLRLRTLTCTAAHFTHLGHGFIAAAALTVHPQTERLLFTTAVNPCRPQLPVLWAESQTVSTPERGVVMDGILNRVGAPLEQVWRNLVGGVLLSRRPDIEWVSQWAEELTKHLLDSPLFPPVRPICECDLRIAGVEGLEWAEALDGREEISQAE